MEKINDIDRFLSKKTIMECEDIKQALLMLDDNIMTTAYYTKNKVLATTILNSYLYEIPRQGDILLFVDVKITNGELLKSTISWNNRHTEEIGFEKISEEIFRIDFGKYPVIALAFAEIALNLTTSYGVESSDITVLPLYGFLNNETRRTIAKGSWLWKIGDKNYRNINGGIYLSL